MSQKKITKYNYTIITITMNICINVQNNEYTNIYTSKVFIQRKQLIWNLKFHADTAAIFS